MKFLRLDHVVIYAAAAADGLGWERSLYPPVGTGDGIPTPIDVERYGPSSPCWSELVGVYRHTPLLGSAARRRRPHTRAETAYSCPSSTGHRRPDHYRNPPVDPVLE